MIFITKSSELARNLASRINFHVRQQIKSWLWWAVIAERGLQEAVLSEVRIPRQPSSLHPLSDTRQRLAHDLFHYLVCFVVDINPWFACNKCLFSAQCTVCRGSEEVQENSCWWQAQGTVPRSESRSQQSFKSWSSEWLLTVMPIHSYTHASVFQKIK